MTKGWWLVLLAGCAKQGGTAPTAELPDPDALFSNYNEQIGCNAEIDDTDFVSVGTMQMPAAGMTGKQTITKVGEGLRVLIELPGLGTIEQGYDGEYAWSVDPMQGPRLLTEDEKGAIEEQGEVCAEASTKYSELAVAGAEDVLERPSWKVTGIDKEGEPVAFWFDQENGLMLGTQRVQKSAMGKVKSVVWMEEYQDFQGIKMATRISTKASGMKVLVTVDEWTFSPEGLEPITAPPLIQELIDERKAAAAPAEETEGAGEAEATEEAAPTE